jgi:N-sulfoglucosamine sulfohydrolase
MGFGPGLGKPNEPAPSNDALTNNTFAAFGDMDASPTKAFVFSNRLEYPEAFQYAFGLRPKVELYNVLTDVDCLSNLAGKAEYANFEEELHQRLMNELRSTGDPRVSDDIVFEKPPFTDANNPDRPSKKSK